MELAAKLAEKAKETERVLKEAEEERRRDRQAVEEVSIVCVCCIFTKNILPIFLPHLRGCIPKSY